MLVAEKIPQSDTDERRDCVISQLFEDQVRRTPSAIGLVSRGRQLTYAELDTRANRLARYLAARGVGPDTLVAVALDRSPDLIVSLLAILKAGGAYVPLDLTHPAERLAMVLDDSRAPLVLTTERLRERLPPLGVVQVACLDREAGAIESFSGSPFDSPARGHNLAYVIYTSGSTGRPKGVMIEHRNATSFFSAMDRLFGADAGVWLAVTSVAFDISVLELLWTLTSGFRVVLHGDEGPYSIPAEIREHGVTHLQCTPSLARILASDPASLAVLRRLLVGGEALPAALARRLIEIVSGNLYNMYGPTETTIWSTYYALGEFGSTVPIGRPLANTYVRILDARLQPAPPGEPGELCIGGEGVARGYWNRPEHTAERFFADPLGGKGRIYRTGDLVRFRPDGVLEFLGRLDNQVKIGGFRIELGEIETTLEQQPGVRQAVALARSDRPGDVRLVAYLVCDPEHRTLPTDLRTALARSLPDYMIPSAFVFLGQLPLTANGKIDRNALPAPAAEGSAADAALPASELERTIAAVWIEALGVESVSLDGNFFDLGAHSLLVAEVHGRLREVLRRDLSLVAMFRYPTIRALAGHLAEAPDRQQPAQTGADRAAKRLAAVRIR